MHSCKSKALLPSPFLWCPRTTPAPDLPKCRTRVGSRGEEGREGGEGARVKASRLRSEPGVTELFQSLYSRALGALSPAVHTANVRWAAAGCRRLWAMPAERGLAPQQAFCCHFLIAVWAIPGKRVQGTSYCYRHRSVSETQWRPMTTWPISQGSESTGEIIHRAGSEQIEDVLGNLQRPGLLGLK